MSELKTEFIPIENAAESLRLLKEGAVSASPTTLWTQGQEVLVKSRLSHWSDTEKALYAWIPDEAVAEKFDSFQKNNGNPFCFLNISLPQASLFIKAEYLGKDKGGFRFSQPDTVYKVQRRQHQRIPILDTIAIKVEFRDPTLPDQRVSRRVVDLSRGGLSFFALADEAAGIQPGQRFEGVTFKIDGHEIKVNAEVRHKKPATNAARTQGFKIGLSFSGISMSEADRIADFVDSETRKYFTSIS